MHEKILLVLLLIFNRDEGFSCGGFVINSEKTISRRSKGILSRRIDVTTWATDNDKADEDKLKEEPESEKEEPLTLYELSLLEERAAKRIDDKLMFPFRMGRAINGALWTFVLIGIALNIFGYGYIRGENGMITIGTLEERNFQIEVNKSAREAMIKEKATNKE